MVYRPDVIGKIALIQMYAFRCVPKASVLTHARPWQQRPLDCWLLSTGRDNNCPYGLWPVVENVMWCRNGHAPDSIEDQASWDMLPPGADVPFTINTWDEMPCSWVVASSWWAFPRVSTLGIGSECLWRMLMGSWPLVGWYPWELGALGGTWMPGSVGIKCTGLAVRFPSFVLITCQVLGTLQGAPETHIWLRPAWCSYIHIHTWLMPGMWSEPLEAHSTLLFFSFCFFITVYFTYSKTHTFNCMILWVVTHTQSWTHHGQHIEQFHYPLNFPCAPYTQPWQPLIFVCVYVSLEFCLFQNVI